MTDEHKSFITTTKGSNWFAVQYWWNPDMGGFWEPWETGLGRYSTEDRAIEEAQDWASADQLEYKPRLKAYEDRNLRLATHPFLTLGDSDEP